MPPARSGGLADLRRALDESRQQQRAIADVLEAITRATSDPQPVLDAILRHAVELCGAEDAIIRRLDGDEGVVVARHVSHPKRFAIAIGQRAPIDMTLIPGGRLIPSGADVDHIPDLSKDPDFGARVRARSAFNTVLGVVLRIDGETYGWMTLTRLKVRPFTEREIELVRTFAQQAAIAIKNVRLFNETKEALEHQTATSEVLKVISSSAFELQPVFDKLVGSAARLCAAEHAWLWYGPGPRFPLAAMYWATNDDLDQQEPGWLESARTVGVAPGRSSAAGRALLERRLVQIPDIQTDPEYTSDKGGWHTLLSVPLLWNGEPIGAINVGRRRVEPFSERQEQLMSTFADQAVIAIKNVRLFNETKEALDQQRAIADVLATIAIATSDPQPVFDVILERAVALCGADHAVLRRLDGTDAKVIASFGTDPRVPQLGDIAPVAAITPGRRIVAGEDVVHITNMVLEPPTGIAGVDDPRRPRETFPTRLGVAVRIEGRLYGWFNLVRGTLRPFSDREIQLVKTFADQAAIAIENVRLFNETKEALERQTAISEVLRSISGSPTDVAPVLQAIAENAVRFCAAEDAFVMLVDGNELRNVGHFGPIASRIGVTMPLDRGYVAGRAVIDRAVVHVHDIQTAAEDDYPTAKRVSQALSFHTILGAPLLRETAPLGAIVLRRREARPFDDKQVELLRTFADQAVIALENVRLFNETKDALERQTAISEILRVITSSPTDVRPVLEAVAESALRFCGAEDALVMLPIGGRLHQVAHRGPVPGPELSYPIETTSMNGKAFVDAAVVHVSDLQAAADEFPLGAEHARANRYHAALVAPLLREGRAIGTIALRRAEAGPFSPRQVELVQTFADQAAIAIENVRLFNETKEALERQTAIAEILRTMSASPTDTQPVFDAIAESATRFAAAEDASVLLARDGQLVPVAHHGPIAMPQSVPLDRGSVSGRSVIEVRTVHVEDVTIGDEYPVSRDAGLQDGQRTVLAAPLARGGRALGTIVMRRSEARPFSERQIELARTFADQAAITIENLRLFNETREALEQQTASGEVLRVISRTTFDIQPVLDAVVQTAGRLVRADAAWIRRAEGGQMLRIGAGGSAAWGATPGISGAIARSETGIARAQAERPERVLGAATVPGHRVPPARSIMALVFREARTVHVHDLATREDLQSSGTALHVGARTLLAVPLLRQGEPKGYMVIARTRVEPFTDQEIRLAETFADQAAIAIENVRLFNEIQDKSRQLEVASRHKSEFLANMSHELRTPLNAIIGFTDVMLQEMFGSLNAKQKEYLEDVRDSGAHLLTLINDILDLSKIEAGRVELEPTTFSLGDAIENALTLVRERAARHAISLAADVSPDVGTIVADERKLKQVVVNLLSNAVKFTPDGGWIGITARCHEDHVEVAVRDTGIGIAPEDQERVFEEFQQVGKDPDRSREGTGLGLALSKRFVELHGGRIWVESEVGKGSTFTFTIPVRQTASAPLGA